jgi:hypothetical protein
MADAEYMKSPVGEKTVEAVTKQGFVLPTLDTEDQPMIPHDLDDLDDKMLMEEFALFTAWADYANAQVGLAVISEREAELEYDWQVSLHMSDAPKKSVTVTKAEALQNPDVYAARKTLDEAYAYRRVVTDLAARYERDANVLSRELTRRTSESSAKNTRREKWAQ